MIENNVSEGFKNNVLGTISSVEACIEQNIKKIRELFENHAKPLHQMSFPVSKSLVIHILLERKSGNL